LHAGLISPLAEDAKQPIANCRSHDLNETNEPAISESRASCLLLGDLHLLQTPACGYQDKPTLVAPSALHLAVLQKWN
jgi:hypothetical protein